MLNQGVDGGLSKKHAIYVVIGAQWLTALICADGTIIYVHGVLQFHQLRVAYQAAE